MSLLDKLLPANPSETAQSGPEMLLNIGDEAEDTITGFAGVVIAYSINLYNCDRAGIQPRELQNGQPAEAVWFDVPQLTVKATKAVAATPAAACKIQLGDTVKDTLTGLTGKVVSMSYWLNGCVRVGVQPAKLKDGQPVEESWFAAAQLELQTPEKPRTEVRPIIEGGPIRAPKQMRNPR